MDLSTIEPEFITCTESVNKGLWLRGFIRQLGIINSDAIDTSYCDSQFSNHSSKHTMFHSKSKHVNVKLHLIRSIASQALTKLDKVSTEENLFDMLTKPIQQNEVQSLLEFD